MPEVESVRSGITGVKLGFMKRVHQTTSQDRPSRRMDSDEYPKLFTGVGCLRDTYHAEGAIQIVHPPNKVPVTQREKVIEELIKMDEKPGVIVRQREPTEGANLLIVEQKPTGAMRLCIDPRDLCAAMKRCH